MRLLAENLQGKKTLKVTGPIHTKLQSFKKPTDFENLAKKKITLSNRFLQIRNLSNIFNSHYQCANSRTIQYIEMALQKKG